MKRDNIRHLRRGLRLADPPRPLPSRWPMYASLAVIWLIVMLFLFGVI